MSQETREIMETANHYTVESMESEDTGEVQYVFDESQMILGDSDEFNNFTDLVLEDGTRAMIVNGTLLTADGQTLILQDDSDLSQYYVDENTDQILLSQEQDEQFLEIISTQNPQTETQLVQYVQDSDDTSQVQEEVFYIHEDDRVLPVQEQYQLAEVDSENGAVPMQIVKLENQQFVEGMDGVVDLEQFLNQQGLHLEGANYQYAVLKDGKFHIQTMNDTTNTDILKNRNTSNINNETILSPELSYLDLSAIKGKDVNTGEPITLSKYMNKVHTKNKKKEFIFENSNSKIKYDKYTVSNSITSTNSGLKSLINKKITIGKTDKGKLLVGKIINITKKTDASTNSFKSNKNSLERNIAIKNKVVLPYKKNIFNVASKEVVNLVDDDENETVKRNCETNLRNQNSCARTSNSKISSASSIQVGYNNDKGVIITSDSSQTNNTNLKPASDAPLVSKSKKSKEIMLNQKDTSESLIKDETSADVETSPEQSKIVVHKKVVTKDCFDVITRTLIGLMNMESVVKKLRNKTIIIKIIEKTYNRDFGDYSKSISYCTGYMVREYKLNEEADNFSESWKFIPDMNSRDTILGEDNLGTVVKDSSATQNNLRKIANLTIQITINPQGNRTTRVIINPPNMYKCREQKCTKSFRTSSALKVHTSEHHPPTSLSLECTICSIKFKNHQESKEHFLMHQTNDNKGMYECMECNKRFGSSLLLRRHMDIHFKPVNCLHCNQCFSNIRDLNKHLPVHEPVASQPSSVPTILKKGPQDAAVTNAKPHEQKIYCCHICGRQFSRHSNLQRHIEIHQGEGAMYKCAICSCSYHYVSSLTRHVVTCHVDTTNKRAQSVQGQIKKYESTTKPGIHFLQEGQIVEMISLEDMSAENLQYVTGTIGNVTNSIKVEESVEVL